MIKTLKNYWQNNPLSAIMILAAVVRILAVLFARGYAMNDDHFVIIHVAQRWIDGYNDWFNVGHPSGFSLVYTGLHYVLFYILKMVGITDPDFKMYIVRLIHAAYSLLIVYFGYKITLRLSTARIAAGAGLLLALFWVLPFMSVRNLNEMVCIPPLMIGFYQGIRGDEKKHAMAWLYAGILFGIAFAFRYQSVLIPGGIGLLFLVRLEWKKFLWLSTGLLAGIFMLQGVVDWVAWGYPLAAFLQYTVYNIDQRYAYITGPWYRYILLILGILIPPVSIVLITGFFKTYKKYFLLFWPVMIFLAFHSYFPNKQERFILPVLPFLLILCTIGWFEWKNSSSFWQKRPGWLRAGNIWFWTINTILMLALVFNFSKKTLVEPMVYLSHKDDLKSLAMEYDRENLPWFPDYYLGRNLPIFRLYKGKSEEQFLKEINSRNYPPPDYVFFFGEENLEARRLNMEKLLSAKLEFDKRIDPSLVDFIMHKLNPRHNLNLTSYIYRCNYGE